MSLHELKAVSWAGIKTVMACLANVGIDFDVDVSIYIVLVDRQLIFGACRVHIAPFPCIRSRAICHSEILPFFASLKSCQALFLGLPSLINIFSARLQANSG
jgi:hypothetical protein